MDIKRWFVNVGELVTEFFTFVASKLANFKNLSLGEQISYCCVGLGFIMVITSLVMFVLQ